MSLLFAALVVAPYAAADEYVRLVTPVQDSDGPDCATVGTANYKGPPTVDHIIEGGSVKVIASLATEDMSGTKVFVVAAPVNCLTGTNAGEIFETLPPVDAMPQSVIVHIVLP